MIENDQQVRSETVDINANRMTHTADDAGYHTIVFRDGEEKVVVRFDNALAETFSYLFKEQPGGWAWLATDKKDGHCYQFWAQPQWSSKLQAFLPTGNGMFCKVTCLPSDSIHCELPAPGECKQVELIIRDGYVSAAT